MLPTVNYRLVVDSGASDTEVTVTLNKEYNFFANSNFVSLTLNPQKAHRGYTVWCRASDN